MTSQTAPAPTPEPSTPVSRAELRLAVLEELTSLGMTMCRDITQRSVSAPYHPEPRIDPGRSFAAASRAVRLTVNLETRVDEYIIALRNGAPPPLPRWSPPPSAGPRVPATVGAAAGGVEAEGGRRGGDHASMYDAAEREIGDFAEGRDTERLIEAEYEDELTGDFDACVGAVRAQLGLATELAAGFLPMSRSLPLMARVALEEGAGFGCNPHFPTSLASRVDPAHKGEGVREAYRASG